MAKEVLRELSDHPDQILHIPRRLVLRTRTGARLRSMELRHHRVQVSNPIRWRLHYHIN
jgi:hypothetical protein